MVFHMGLLELLYLILVIAFGAICLYELSRQRADSFEEQAARRIFYSRPIEPHVVLLDEEEYVMMGNAIPIFDGAEYGWPF